MTSAFLQSELTSLIADSKKKSPDVRAAAEKSLVDLKSITVTSELQLATDLARRPRFVDPFVLACQSKNAKLAASATASLQRLIASRAVPRDRLEDVLNGLRDVMNIGYEVQLKILQTLPAFLQLYASDVRGQLLARTLEICASLEASKTVLVSSSARATFEQLLDSVFERTSVEDETGKLHERKGSTDSLSSSADDASRVFEDFCIILNGSEPSFLHPDIKSLPFLLQTIDNLVDNNASYVQSRLYLLEACRTQLIPGLATLLGERDDFQTLALCVRITNILLQKYASQLLEATTEVLKVLLSFLDRDSGPAWKRALGLEFFKQVCSNFGLLMRMSASDDEATRKLIPSLVGTLVRVAAEDPTLIGLGRQSTVPVNSAKDMQQDEMASLDAQGIGGGLASVNSADANVTGISLEFSAIDKPLIDDDSTSSSPAVPKTYLYAVILECISSLCEGLSKFVMPLSVSSKHNDNGDTAVAENDGAEQQAPVKSSRRSLQSHKYQRLANPLEMPGLPQLPQVQACARMIEACWPAVLATCSTFLNAALDSHFYHLLIRSMQKLAQVSGTLELGTPP